MRVMFSSPGNSAEWITLVQVDMSIVISRAERNRFSATIPGTVDCFHTFCFDGFSRLVFRRCQFGVFRRRRLGVRSFSLPALFVDSVNSFFNREEVDSSDRL